MSPIFHFDWANNGWICHKLCVKNSSKIWMPFTLPTGIVTKPQRNSDLRRKCFHLMLFKKWTEFRYLLIYISTCRIFSQNIARMQFDKTCKEQLLQLVIVNCCSQWTPKCKNKLLQCNSFFDRNPDGIQIVWRILK